jgi:hypothetical protein
MLRKKRFVYNSNTFFFLKSELILTELLWLMAKIMFSCNTEHHHAHLFVATTPGAGKVLSWYVTLIIEVHSKHGNLICLRLLENLWT